MSLPYFTVAPQPLTFYSHRVGPNPWKTVTVLEEVGVPYEAIFLSFGAGENGVEGSSFKEKNPAGRAPLIFNPNTGISLAESNAIAEYVVDQYDKEGRLTIRDFPKKYLIAQGLSFQGATEGPLFQQGVVFSRKDNLAALSHLQGLIKRTLRAMEGHLKDKTYLVGEKSTIADLAFVNWDYWSALDRAIQGDPEAATMEQREKLYPNWATWHKKLLERDAVGSKLKAQRQALSEGK